MSHCILMNCHVKPGSYLSRFNCQRLSIPLFRATPFYSEYQERLWRQGFDQRYKETYHKTEAGCDFAIVVSDPLYGYCGSALVDESGDLWIVHFLMVIKEMQGQGIGTEILRKIQQDALHGGSHWLLLTCNPIRNRGEALAFYSQLGFKPVEP